MPSKPAAPASPAAFYRVEPPREASLRCVRVRERKLGVPWHFHPEYQLTLLVSGSGQRVVGDSIAAVNAGDLTLLGPSLPHFWDVDLPDARRAGHRRRVDAIIVQFDQAAFGESFWMLPETARVAKLLRSAGRGLVFSARARAAVEEAIVRLARLPALPRLLGLIEILDQLAADARAKPICSPAYGSPGDRGEQHRLAAVIRRIQEHVCEGLEPPHRSELAALAGMAERTLSRSFRGQMGRTLPQFANELRIGRARRMLMETSLSVTAVAQRCGFRNLSNFNTQFRRLAGQTPQAFRQACRCRLSICT